MQRILAFRRKDQTCSADVGIVEVQTDIRVWVLLNLDHVAQKPTLEQTWSYWDT
jgi:hypothetical protein